MQPAATCATCWSRFLGRERLFRVKFLRFWYAANSRRLTGVLIFHGLIADIHTFLSFLPDEYLQLDAKNIRSFSRLERLSGWLMMKFRKDRVKNVCFFTGYLYRLQTLIIFHFYTRQNNWCVMASMYWYLGYDVEILLKFYQTRTWIKKYAKWWIFNWMWRYFDDETRAFTKKEKWFWFLSISIYC